MAQAAAVAGRDLREVTAVTWALAGVDRPIDIERLAPQLDGDVVPMYVDLSASAPAELDGLPEPVIAPDLSEGNHLSYAVQWFLFSAAAAAGWLLAVRYSVRKRARSAARDAAAEQPAPDGVPVA